MLTERKSIVLIESMITWSSEFWTERFLHVIDSICSLVPSL